MTSADMVTAFKEVGFERVYHITHMANLPTVMVYGLHSKKSVDSLGIPIHDISLETAQQRREDREVLVSANGDVRAGGPKPLHAMVPFYFNPRNTMMYLRASERVPLCILVTRIERILDGSRRVAFSDGNLAANVSRSFCDRRQFTDVRWDLVKTASWAGDRDVERIMCAEFLVEDLVPADLIDSVEVGGPKGRAVAIARLAGTRLAGHVKMNSRLFFDKCP